MKKLKDPQCEELAFEIFHWLVKKQMWQDVRIYDNGKALDTYNPETGEYYYNQDKY